jgi:hypothetical protein
MSWRRIALALVWAGMSTGLPWCAVAQDLSPRAYLITPINSNVLNVTISGYDGGVLFNGAAPITDTHGNYVVPILSYYRSLNFFGRSANFLAALPYGVGNFSGKIGENAQSVYRSGLADFTCRFSVNLIGGPAMHAREFVKWKQKALLGASLKVIAPTGQYDPRKLVNWGINRWAFKPELGYSQRWGNWIVDSYAGVWFYTSNPAYYDHPLPQPQAENPIGSFEGHLSYDFPKERLWASLDGNYWFGGETTLAGIPNIATRQTSSRIGATVSIPLTKHQSIKAAYSDGTYIRFGGNYQNVTFGWQYSWLDHWQ